MGTSLRAAAGASLLALAVAACGSSRTQTSSYGGTVPPATVSDFTRGWPAKSREAAAAMEQKYGAPNERTESMLIWHGNGPWKRTVVYNYEVPHSWPEPHTDVIEQFINYRAPADAYDELAEFDGSVVAARTVGELSARCGVEAMNFLAVNVAHDVATRRRTVQQARQEYQRAAMAFMNGQREPITQRLQFQPATDTRDPDRPR